MRPILLGRAAEADLERIFGYIAGESSTATALDYRARLDRFLRQLETFPYAGREIRGGRRRLSFERRVDIVYRVRAKDVLVLGVKYAGQRTSDQEPR